MQKFIATGVRRAYSSTPKVFAAEQAAAGGPTNMIINFCTPHQPIFTKKVVESVVIPGAGGEYGVTLGHSPIIAQLKPGVVQVNHAGGQSEKYFVPGGFAITHANAVTDISVPEAFLVSELDEAAIRSGHAEATKNAASAAENTPAKARAIVESEVYSAMAQAIGLTL